MRNVQTDETAISRPSKKITINFMVTAPLKTDSLRLFDKKLTPNVILIDLLQ